MIDDSELDALRDIAGRIRMEAEQSVYGHFPGGDPREFSPDPECTSPDEMARWTEDCAKWEAGEQIDRGPHHLPLDADTKDVIAQVIDGATGKGWKTVCHYGFGVYTYRDAELLKLAQDMDDVIDRIHAASVEMERG